MKIIIVFIIMMMVVMTVSAAASTAKLLFASNFASGVTLGPIIPPEDGRNHFQKILGTDSETGFSWPINLWGAYFSGLQIITVDNVSETTIGTEAYNVIRPVVGPKGTIVNELFQNLLVKEPVGYANAQIPLLLQRLDNIGDVPDFYLTYWFWNPPDLASRLMFGVSGPAGAGWRVQFEFKTGGYLGQFGGDYRIAVLIFKDIDGSLYWYTKGDNVANGVNISRVDYWIVRNKNVPVPVGQWYKFETFLHRSSGSDGRYWAAVNGQVIVDHIGPNMGDFGLPINRLLFNDAYTGGAPPVESHTTGLEIWDGFPCGEGNSCYEME